MLRFSAGPGGEAPGCALRLACILNQPPRVSRGYLPPRLPGARSPVSVCACGRGRSTRRIVKPTACSPTPDMARAGAGGHRWHPATTRRTTCASTASLHITGWDRRHKTVQEPGVDLRLGRVGRRRPRRRGRGSRAYRAEVSSPARRRRPAAERLTGRLLQRQPQRQRRTLLRRQRRRASTLRKAGVRRPAPHRSNNHSSNKEGLRPMPSQSRQASSHQRAHKARRPVLDIRKTMARRSRPIGRNVIEKRFAFQNTPSRHCRSKLNQAYQLHDGRHSCFVGPPRSAARRRHNTSLSKPLLIETRFVILRPRRCTQGHGRPMDQCRFPQEGCAMSTSTPGTDLRALRPSPRSIHTTGQAQPQLPAAALGRPWCWYYWRCGWPPAATQYC